MFLKNVFLWLLGKQSNIIPNKTFKYAMPVKGFIKEIWDIEPYATRGSCKTTVFVDNVQTCWRACLNTNDCVAVSVSPESGMHLCEASSVYKDEYISTAERSMLLLKSRQGELPTNPFGMYDV